MNENVNTEDAYGREGTNEKDDANERVNANEREDASEGRHKNERPVEKRIENSQLEET